MAKIIRCDDGYVARGETDDELVKTAMAHVRAAHSAPVHRLPAERLTQPGQQHGKRRVHRRRCVIAPDRVHQLVAVPRTGSGYDQIAQEQPALAAPQPIHRSTVEFDVDPAAQLDTG
jgi:hypothetical protein